MVRRSILLFLIIFNFCYVDTLFGQAYRPKQYAQKLIIRAGTGTSHYFGDLVDDWDFTFDGNFTAGARYPFWDRVSASADLTWAMLHGNDASSETKAPRNLSFFSHNLELSLTAQVDLFPEPVRFYRRNVFNPYLFGGIGVLMYGPKTRYNGETYALRPLKTEGQAESYGTFTLSFPFGAGLRYKLNAFMNISAEGGLRYTTTDYLDDVHSGIFPDPASFTDPIAKALSDRSGEYGLSPTMAEEQRNVRGNPDHNDAYGLFLIRVEYYLTPLQDSFKSIMYQGRKTRMRRR
ncbi:MAG TPA: DUF6089 family protein [Cyclobacteriaceae bacterium]|nr:DUF6089 family protein [Cyclobacteriaceae bacterium]